MLKRNVLWWMILFLLFTNTLVTININLAIVSMVNGRGAENTSKNQSDVAVCPSASIFVRDSFSRDNLSLGNVFERNEYDWSDVEQNTVLSGYYWLNYLSILLGGVLSHKYGPKLIVGYAQLISSTLSSVIPLVARHGSGAVTWVRAIQGVLSFLSVPAGVYSIMGNWIPSSERGKFGSSYALGSWIGIMSGSLVFGYVARYLHWSYVFHLTSICGIVWSALWYKCIYNFPAQHPTITFEELKYIENDLKNAIKTKRSIPWRSIFTNMPFVVCVLGWCSGVWIMVVLITYIPSYLNTIYGLNSDEIGMFISFTYLLGCVITFIIGHYSDLAIRRNMISMTNMRKICTFIGNAVCVIPLVFMVFIRCNFAVAVVCITLASVVRSFAMFGAGLVVIDLSPTFSGVLEGVSGTTYSLVTFVFAAGVNHLTTLLDIETLWNVVFVATAIFAVFCSTMFVIFGSSEVQSWNFEHDGRKEAESKEMTLLGRD